MQTREQKDALLALGHVQEIERRVENDQNEELRKSYITATHRFPFLVRQNGLQQTLGFYSGKAKAKENSSENQENAEAAFLRHITEVLDEVLESGSDDLLERVLKASLENYMRCSHRCLEAALWYRRFADSLLDDEDQKNTKGDGDVNSNATNSPS